MPPQYSAMTDVPWVTNYHPLNSGLRVKRSDGVLYNDANQSDCNDGKHELCVTVCHGYPQIVDDTYCIISFAIFNCVITFHRPATTPPVIGCGAPVVPGNVIGRPLRQRTARNAKACASIASDDHPTP